MFGLIPFKTNQLNKNQEGFENLFGDFFNDDFLSPLNGNSNKFSADIKENDSEYLVCAELPGVKKEDIELDFKDNKLIISAKREDIVDEKKENYIRKERNYGEFTRVFTFMNIDKDKITAKFENGELKITLPKKAIEKEQKSKIEIK